MPRDTQGFMDLLTSLSAEEGMPPISPRMYHHSVEMRERVQRILEQNDGWVLVITKRTDRMK